MTSVDPYAKLINLAWLFIGVVESGGDNRGSLIELFQKAVDGKANGEPWCCAFVQFLLKQVDMEMHSIDPRWQFSRLAKTESCVKLWDLSPVACRNALPRPGSIVVWRQWSFYSKENRWLPTSFGHTGIITKLNDDGTMETIEGNTSAGVGIERNGDGVFQKTRHQAADSGAMRVLGFLRPWEVANP